MKHVLTFAFAALFVAGVQAQSLSVKGGANFSNIIKTGDDDFKTDFKPGFFAGLGLDIPIISALSFAPEILYSQKGYKTTSTDLLGAETKYSVTSNFVDIPILAKVSTSSFNLHFGPQLSFLTSTTESFEKGSQEYRNTIKEENNNLKKSILGGVAGIGFNLAPKVSLNGRYAIDFQKNNEDGTKETPLYRNQVIQVGLGIKL